MSEAEKTAPREGRKARRLREGKTKPDQKEAVPKPEPSPVSKANRGEAITVEIKALVQEAIVLGHGPTALAIWELAEPAMLTLFRSMGPRASVLGLFNALVSDTKNKANIQNGSNMFMMGIGQMDDHVPELFRVCVEHIRISSDEGKDLNPDDPAWSRIGSFLSTVLSRNKKHESFIATIVYMVWGVVRSLITLDMATGFFERMVTYKQYNEVGVMNPTEEELLCGMQLSPAILEYARLIPRVEDVVRAIPKMDTKREGGEPKRMEQIAEMCSVCINSGFTPTLKDMVELPRPVSAFIIGRNDADLSAVLPVTDMYRAWRADERHIRGTCTYLAYTLPSVLRMFAFAYEEERRPKVNELLAENQHRVLFYILGFLLGEEYGFIKGTKRKGEFTIEEVDKELVLWLKPNPIATSAPIVEEMSPEESDRLLSAAATAVSASAAGGSVPAVSSAVGSSSHATVTASSLRSVQVPGGT